MLLNDYANKGIDVTKFSSCNPFYDEDCSHSFIGTANHADISVCATNMHSAILEQEFGKNAKALLDCANPDMMQIRGMAGCLNALNEFFPNSLYPILNTNFFDNYVKPHIKNYGDKHCSKNLFPNGIGIFLGHPLEIRFILPVINALPRQLLRIILYPGNKADELLKIGFDQQSIFNEIDALLSCDVCFIDAGHILGANGALRNFQFGNQKIICWSHGSDWDIPPCERIHLCIGMSARQFARKDRFSAKGLEKRLKEIPFQQKCEFSYSGTYQIPYEFSDLPISKANLRKQLASQLHCHIPDDRPLIACFEDAMANHEQLFAVLNNLSEYCTIIVKFVYSPNANILNQLNKSIIIHPSDGYAPNLLRFASDFIMCGSFGSTALSSIMLGLNIIVYYSTICTPRWKATGFPISTYKIDAIDLTNDTSSKFFRRYFKLFFDLNDFNRIRSAIFSDLYLETYRKSLPTLQKIIFGDYIKVMTAEQTASRILRFAVNDTLEEECNQFYLKDKCFF